MSKKTLPTSLSLDSYKPASEDFEFQRYPFYWLMKVSSAYSMRMESSLKKEKINITAWRILMILTELGQISVTDIATHAVSKTPTITRAIYKMQEQELVDISTSKADGRVSLVQITDKGEQTILKVKENSRKLFEGVYQGVSVEEIESLNTLLAKFYNNLEH